MKMTFEEAMKRLEEIVTRLEDKSLPLDAALEDFDNAISLVKYCNEVLSQAEIRISEVTGEE